jgi:hypothetical protein
MNPPTVVKDLSRVRDFGLAYVICRVNYLRVVMAHAPAGRSGYRLAGLRTCWERVSWLWLVARGGGRGLVRDGGS